MRADSCSIKHPQVTHPKPWLLITEGGMYAASRVFLRRNDMCPGVATSRTRKPNPASVAAALTLSVKRRGPSATTTSTPRAAKPRNCCEESVMQEACSLSHPSCGHQRPRLLLVLGGKDPNGPRSRILAAPPTLSKPIVETISKIMHVDSSEETSSEESRKIQNKLELLVRISRGDPGLFTHRSYFRKISQPQMARWRAWPPTPLRIP